MTTNKVLLRLLHWLDRDGARNQEQFHQRLRADPQREYQVQKVRRFIMDHEGDEERAALEIVEHLFPSKP
jgi:hypothetical protein